MNILQLCNKSPVPPKEGGPIAMYHLAQALVANGHFVDVLSVVTPKYNPEDSIIDSYLSEQYAYEKVFVNTNVTFGGALKAFLTSKAYHVSRFVSQDFTSRLIHKLSKKTYDLVIFETLYMSPYLEIVRQHSEAVCILRSHNIEHQIWKRVAANEKNVLKKWYLNHLTRSLNHYERKVIPQFDAIACISQNEVENYECFGSSNAVGIVPFGLNEINPVNRSAENNGKDFYHIGSMDWIPNIEGARWLLDHVVPILEKKAPHIRIFLAGRNMPDWIRNYKSEIVVVSGEVDDAADFIADKAVLLVPLFSGSGIRIKIIEAMSAGKAVISTTTGIEGIHAQHGVHLLIADQPEEFADAMIALHSEPDQAFQLGQMGQKQIISYHNYKTVIQSFNILIRKMNESANDNKGRSVSDEM